MKTQIEIYAKMNNVFNKERCSLTGEIFEPGSIYFRVDGGGMVSPREALKRGFTFKPEDFEIIERAVDGWCEMIEMKRAIAIIIENLDRLRLGDESNDE